MRLLVVIGLTACSFEHGWPTTAQPDDATSVADTARAIDATGDAAGDAALDARTCPAAPSGCSLFSCASSTSCYYACGTSSTGQLTWSNARNRCSSAGVGCIVTINSQAEQDCIVTHTNPVFPDNVWFGLRQSTGGSEPGGGWGWECPPSTYVFPQWGTSEPNNQGGNEDCGLLATGGGWNDGDCGTTQRYVCELP